MTETSQSWELTEAELNTGLSAYILSPGIYFNSGISDIKASFSKPIR